MKAKLKLDKDAIRGFFVQQSEKIVFGLFVLFGLLFCYGAVSRERYARTPEEMQEESTAVAQIVENGTAASADAVPAVEPLAGLLESLSQDFNPNAAAPEVWDLPLYPPKIRREEPVYLALSGLRAHADTGPIAYRGAGQPMAGPPGGAPDGPMGGAPAAGAAPPGVGQLPPGGPSGAPAGGRPGRPGAGAMPPGGMPGGMPAGGMPGAMGGAATGEDSLGVVPPEGSRIEHREWVCLTGVVPVGDQLSEFNKKFGNASYRNPESDRPQYVDFEILRAEVVSGVPADQLQWEELDVHQLLRDEYGKWATVYPDVVSPMNEETMVCEPLPPLVTKNHDESHVGHPEIPLLSAEMRGMAQRPAAERAPSAEEEDSNPLGQPGGRGPGGGMPGGGFPGAPGGGFPGAPGGGLPGGQRGAGGAPGGPGGMPGGMPGAPGGGFPGGAGGAPGGLPGGIPGAAGGMPGGQGMLGGQGMGRMMGGPGGGRSGVDVKKKLFRFFDFSVEQGKTYRYQVRLVLRNPNERILPQYLAAPDLASGELRLSLWSEISEPVTIPRPINIVPGPVAQAAGGREPTARLIVRIWNDELGVGASSDATVARGSQIDFLARETAVVDPRSGEVRKEKIDVLTDSAVVDMSGGDAFTEMEDLRGAKGPSDLLLLNADGELEILSYFDDPGTYDTEMKKVEKLNALLEKPGGAGGGPPGLFGGMPGGAGGAGPPGMPGMPGAGGAGPPGLFGPQQGGGRQRRGR